MSGDGKTAARRSGATGFGLWAIGATMHAEDEDHSHWASDQIIICLIYAGTHS